MIEKILETLKDIYPDNEWAADHIGLVDDKIWSIYCDGEKTKCGYSEKTARNLASLTEGDIFQQTLNSIMAQLDDYMEKRDAKSNREDGRKSNGLY